MRSAEIQQAVINLLNEIGKTDTIELTPGQVISVLLKEVQGNMALLTYQGKEILAQLEAELPVGERLKCLVEGQKNGQIILKVLTGNRAAGDTLKSIINTLGLTVDKTNLQLVTEMIKQEMPLTPDTARILSAFTRSFNVPEGDMWVPVFMLKQGIPLTQQTYQAVKALFTDMNYLQAEMNKLISATEGRAIPVKPGSELGRLAADINQAIRDLQLTGSDGQESLVSKLTALIKLLNPEPVVSSQGKPVGLPPTLQSGGPQTGSGTAQGANTSPADTPQVNTPQVNTPQVNTPQVNTPQVNTPQVNTPQVNTPQANTLQANTPQANVPQAAAQSTVNTVQTGPGQVNPGQIGSPGADLPQPSTAQPNAGQYILSGTTQADAEASGAKPGPPAPQVAEKEIIARFADLADKWAAPLDKPVREEMLTRIQAVLEQAGKEPPKTDLVSLLDKFASSLAEYKGQDYSDLLQLAKNVMGKLELMQNFNSKTGMNSENIMVVYSSVRFEENQEPLRLIINYRYDGKGKKRDFSSCKVEVTLNTPGLGLVRCEVQVHDKNLALQFITENEPSGKIIDNAKDVLVKRLEEMNYSVEIQRCKVLTKQDGGFLSNDQQEVPGLFRLNVRV